MPEQYKLPSSPSKFAEDLDQVALQLFTHNRMSLKAKLKFDENTQQYNQEVEILGKDIMRNTNNNIMALVYDYLINETDSSEIEKKILFICETAKNLAESGNYFALEPILQSLKKYLSIIRRQEIDGKLQNLSNFEDLAEEINKAVRLFRTNDHVRAGLKAGAHNQKNVRFPAMMKTIEQLELNLLEVTTSPSGLGKTERLTKLKRYQDVVANEIDMCTGVRAKNTEPSESLALYSELASEDFHGMKSFKLTMQQIQRMYEIRESGSIKSKKSILPKKWVKNETHIKIKESLSSIEESYKDEIEDIRPSLPSAPKKPPRYMAFITEKMQAIDEAQQGVNLDREAFVEYISYVLGRIRAQEQGVSLEDDEDADYLEIYLRQVMLDYEDYHLKQSAEEILAAFESYADMDLVCHGKDPEDFEPLNWRDSIKKFSKIAEHKYAEISDIVINEQSKSYIKNIILSIKKDSDLSEHPKHGSTQKYFKSLIDEGDLNLTLDSSPEDIIGAI